MASRKNQAMLRAYVESVSTRMSGARLAGERLAGERLSQAEAEPIPEERLAEMLAACEKDLILLELREKVASSLARAVESQPVERRMPGWRSSLLALKEQWQQARVSEQARRYLDPVIQLLPQSELGFLSSDNVEPLVNLMEFADLHFDEIAGLLGGGQESLRAGGLQPRGAARFTVFTDPHGDGAPHRPSSPSLCQQTLSRIRSAIIEKDLDWLLD